MTASPAAAPRQAARTLAAFLAGCLIAAGGTWAILANWPPAPARPGQAPQPDVDQLTAFRQYAMSFSAKMGEAKSVDPAGQFASASIRFHALPDPPELFASTNIRRWNYSFSRTRLFQVYFVVLVFDQPMHDFKVRAIQNQGVVPMVVSDASERTVLLQFIGEPAERAVTVDILKR